MSEETDVTIGNRIPPAAYEIANRIKVGDRVEHPRRGTGTVVAEIEGHPSVVRVDFPSLGRVQTCKKVDLWQVSAE